MKVPPGGMWSEDTREKNSGTTAQWATN